MSRQQLEKTLVQHPLLDTLKFYVLTGDVIWFQKLSAEDDRYCEAGTLDTIAIVDQKNGSVVNMFIECKKPGERTIKRRATKKVEENYSFEQRDFVNRMSGKPKIYCCIIDDADQFSMHLNKAKKL